MLTIATDIAALAVVLLVLTTMVWFKRVGRVAIPDNRFVFLLLWWLAVLLGAASFFSSQANWLSGIYGALAILGGGTLLALYALRKQGVGEEAISVGEAIPHFSAVDEEGVIFDSLAMAGSPVLLKFFRGHW